MITSDIAVKLNVGQHDTVMAVVTPGTLSEIFDEFRRTPDWAYFEDYCAALVNPENANLTPAPFVQKFEDQLSSILDKHTKYRVALFWPVVHAMSEHVTGRKPW